MSKPTGTVNIKNHKYAPFPVPSFHIDPPWKTEVTIANKTGIRPIKNPRSLNGIRATK